MPVLEVPTDPQTAAWLLEEAKRQKLAPEEVTARVLRASQLRKSLVR